MRTFFFCLLSWFSVTAVGAQTPMKQFANTPYVDPRPLQISKAPGVAEGATRLGGQWHPTTLPSLSMNHKDISSIEVSPSGSYWIDLKPNQLWASRSSLESLMESLIPGKVNRSGLAADWIIRSEETDQAHIRHIRIQQTIAGIPIYGQDMILHVDQGSLRDLNGFAWTGKWPEEKVQSVSSEEAIAAAKSYLESREVKFNAPSGFPGLRDQQDHAALIWYPNEGHLILAYEIEMHPNPMDHWTLIVSASDLSILKSFSELCSFAPTQLYDLSGYSGKNSIERSNKEVAMLPAPPADGATVTTDQDLKNANRTVNGYQVGNTFYMIDASRTGMYQPAQSVMPNEPVGTIWTIDAQNTSPQQSDFEVVHVTNTNNNWKNLEVSAHYNGGEAYEYFRQTFSRNSINGMGGNIISIINVTDQNDNNMDNAFWNGTAMFYGNGNVAFNAPLAKALDVAGHEMSHGVIQNTANLEYVGQSGALNESFADIFGALIDRDDWKMGEDVTNSAIFPTGAIRDLSNPNNGGSGPSSPGWQPKHMNEFQNLPNTPEGDNGGVHVNSGIPNKAFFNLANSIGKEKAEQIYYKALKDYLVKSSQFVDCRNAVEKAAMDLHGANSAEVTAVQNAFAAVGIGAGAGGDYEDDLDNNPGDDFILATDESQSDLYWIPPGNPGQFIKMEVPAPISRPSFTDDGTACVYVDNENNMILINFNWSQGLSYQAFYLEDNPQGIWRNVVVSKDGARIAYTTSNLRNEINVYDFNGGGNEVFLLYNPTTAAGGAETGDVLYPDIMEWDYSGEYVMYDALSRIESGFGNGIEYWDIGFLNVWDNGSDNFASGQIGKLFSGLPENISVGNPSFAKNSPYIIVFDLLESYFDFFGQEQTDYYIKAANIETGDLNDIYQNTTTGYPNYSRLDDKILFTYDNNGALLLATIDVNSDDKTLPVPGTDVVLINGAQKGIWFTTGTRDITATKESGQNQNRISVFPQPASDRIFVAGAFEGPITYFVFDLAGVQVQSGDLATDRSIQVNALNSGTYLLQIKTQNGSLYNSRFIKI